MEDPVTNRYTKAVLFEDFLTWGRSNDITSTTATYVSDARIYGATTGTAAALQVQAFHGGGATVGSFGLLKMYTGTDSTGEAQLQDGYIFFGTSITPSGNIGATTLEIRLIHGQASTSSERYGLILGFSDATLASADNTVDGVYFYYKDDVNSNQFQCITVSNSTATTTNTSVAVVDYETHILSIVVNAGGTSVAFYIDSTLVATHTTNIPVLNARGTYLTTKIYKTVGTATRYLDIDYIMLSRDMTWPRNIV